MKSFSTLSEIREEIDRIDNDLLSLLTERAQCSLAVAQIKHAAGSTDPNYYRPEREAQILRRMVEHNQGPLDDQSIMRFYREVISSSLALEEPMSIAYLGPEGTFTHAATLKHFGSAVITQPQTTIAEIFRAVETGEARFGVVPIENSTEGMINQTLDLLMESRLRICGESRLRIEHNLLGGASPGISSQGISSQGISSQGISSQGNTTQDDSPEGSITESVGSVNSFASIESVHAHPQALAQCRNWLDKHLPKARRVSEDSNAAAAQKISNDATAVAIAGIAAAGHYELIVLQKNIEDVIDNTTRFFVIGHVDIPPSGKDATSLLISAPHKPGGLRKILEPFEQSNISMTRLESRPSRTNLWSYNFFIDIDGHKDDAVLQPVLKAMAAESQLLRVLGSYPSAL